MTAKVGTAPFVVERVFLRALSIALAFQLLAISRDAVKPMLAFIDQRGEW
jgi:hypothetical protein